MLVPLLLSLAPQSAPPPPPDWVIPTGSTVFYDTAGGPIRINSLTVEPGALLRILGPQPFVLMADSHVLVDGSIDASGFHAKVVGTLLTPFLPEIGAHGAAAGGQGGTGSPLTRASSPKGGDGWRTFGWRPLPRGARGGESGWSPSTDKQVRRGAGGAGGGFALDVIGGGPGMAAEPGADGHPAGVGAITGMSPPQGGPVNQRPFQDGDPTNDFWGRKLNPSTLQIIVGELMAPSAGVGGGAGGDSIFGSSFPTIPFGPPYKDKKGAGGGGGGGLIVVSTRKLSVGPSGSIVADGGNGTTGENVLGFDHIGGSSGGGSGGMIVLEAELVDLSQTSADALHARGGIGGIGNELTGWSKGGNGGPGLIQVHVRNPLNQLLLPAGASLADLSAPDAQVLLPELH